MSQKPKYDKPESIGLILKGVLSSRRLKENGTLSRFKNTGKR